MIPNVLAIAGSDPSGGAGVQADLKTVSANGGYAMAALTALTVQNTQGVSGVERVAPDFVAQQIEAVFADVRVDAVKIGMIATAGIAEAVADALASRGATRIVLDPVMVAKGGDRLLDESATRTLAARLLPLAGLLTPNLPEAAALLGQDEASSREEMLRQAEALRALGPEAVLLKGGHLDGADSPDLLHTGSDALWLEAPRIDTRNTHGTGCTLSSAIATRWARHGDLAAACRSAKAYVSRAIAGADALSVGSGHGPLDHFFFLRKEWNGSSSE